MLDAYKELTPVVYGENAIKYLYTVVEEKNGRMCFPMHWHERMELVGVADGSLEVHFGEWHCRLHAGQVAVINPGQLHGGFAGEDGVVYHTIMFDVQKFCNGTIASDKYLLPFCQGKYAFRNVIEDERLFAIVNRIADIQKNGARENPLRAIGTIYEMLGILYEYRDGSAKILYSQDMQYSEVLAYINEHFAEDISAKSLSERFGYNESYFSRRFREITGITFGRYVLALRMEQAQKLLQGGREPVGNVAWQCGFADVSYFTKCFKKLFGYTPTHYRQL